MGSCMTKRQDGGSPEGCRSQIERAQQGIRAKPVGPPAFKEGQKIYLKAHGICPCIHTHNTRGPWLVVEKNNAVSFARDPNNENTEEVITFCEDCVEGVMAE